MDPFQPTARRLASALLLLSAAIFTFSVDTKDHESQRTNFSRAPGERLRITLIVAVSEGKDCISGVSPARVQARTCWTKDIYTKWLMVPKPLTSIGLMSGPVRRPEDLREASVILLAPHAAGKDASGNRRRACLAGCPFVANTALFQFLRMAALTMFPIACGGPV